MTDEELRVKMEAARAETFGQFQHMAKVALEQQRRAERAEAELAALTAQRDGLRARIASRLIWAYPPRSSRKGNGK